MMKRSIFQAVILVLLGIIVGIMVGPRYVLHHTAKGFAGVRLDNWTGKVWIVDSVAGKDGETLYWKPIAEDPLPVAERATK